MLKLKPLSTSGYSHISVYSGYISYVFPADEENDVKWKTLHVENRSQPSNSNFTCKCMFLADLIMNTLSKVGLNKAVIDTLCANLLFVVGSRGSTVLDSSNNE